MKTLVVGTARDISHVWSETSRYLDIVFAALEDYECLIVESNSSDSTLTVLNDWARENSRRKILSLGNLSEESRTKRIAYCRNKYMEYLDDNISQFDYMLAVDLDSSLEIDPDFKNQLRSCFVRNDWDAVASNRRGRYYDIWALRSKQLGIDFDCWEIVNSPTTLYNRPRSIRFITHRVNSLPTRDELVYHFVRRYQQVIPESADWIECQSAFGGMALYKASSVRGRRYSGDSTCEHVSFNSGLKMFINPYFISGGEPLEHLP